MEQENTQPREGQRKRRPSRSYTYAQPDRTRSHVAHKRQTKQENEKQSLPPKKQSLSPEKNPKSKLKVIPLGGLDAIGKNMTVFECDGDIVLDDAGLMFPDDDHPGIDLILPNYTYVLEHADQLKGIVITHGHEDHTGCLPYLMKDLDRVVSIYGTKMTLGLIEGKFAEHKIKNAKLIEVTPGQRIRLGCITCDFFAVNHSIPGALGIFFQTPAGNILHTGDFKLDQTPIDGVTTDFGALARFNRIGVDLMMSDSTNATIPLFTPSEATVGVALNEIISKATGRVVIASFASHIHRLQQICDAAVANGRKVVVTGRSMVQNTDIARKLGYLNISDQDLIDAYDLKGLPPEKVVVMCTGSQGEPLSALARIATGEHKTVRLERGDTVIISASPVPGNEKAVTRIINLLAKVGADVYSKNRAPVHVSGHAGQEELKLVLSIAKPKAFLPVHGEAAHLRAHAKLAETVGVPRDKIFILENGESLELDVRGIRRGEPVESGAVFVDGLSVGDTSEDVLRERSRLVDTGVATIACAVSYTRQKLLSSVTVQTRGISGGDDPLLIQDMETVVESALIKALDNRLRPHDIEKACRHALQQVLWGKIEQRPMVIVNLVEI